MHLPKMCHTLKKFHLFIPITCLSFRESDDIQETILDLLIFFRTFLKSLKNLESLKIDVASKLILKFCKFPENLITLTIGFFC